MFFSTDFPFYVEKFLKIKKIFEKYFEKSPPNIRIKGLFISKKEFCEKYSPLFYTAGA
jgi:hypothetical protein